MDLKSASIRISNSSYPRSLPTDSVRLRIPTSLSQFIALLEKFGLSGPIHLDRGNLENQLNYKCIGSGSQFTVFKPVADGLFEGYVVKRAELQRSDLKSDRESQRLKLKIIDREIRTLCDERIRRHSNIVGLDRWGFDYSDLKELDPRPFLVVQEAVCSLGDLLRKPTEFHGSVVSFDQKYMICLDVASGLECLRQCGIVHGDLKPDNILIFNGDGTQGKFIAKLSDFGLSIFIADDDGLSFSHYRSTPHWQPPETVSTRRHDKVEPSQLFKCDSYSYGLLALSTLALDNAKSPLGELERRDAGRIRDDINSALGHSLGLSVAEKEQAIRCSEEIFKHFVVDSPLDRAFVSPELLRDDKSSAYTTWHTNYAVGRLKAPEAPAFTYHPRHGFKYWSSIDHATFRLLELDLKDSVPHNTSLEIPSDALFGMACVYCTLKPDGFSKLALDYCIAAVKQDPPSAPAQGMIMKLANALHPTGNEYLCLFDLSTTDILFEASASGSWIAAAELTKLDRVRALSALSINRKNGGYNMEKIDRSRHRMQSSSFSIENGYLDISLLDIQTAELDRFTCLSDSQLCHDCVDKQQNTLLHLAAMLGRDDLVRHIPHVDPVSLNRQNRAGETPLYKACAAGHSDCVELLLSFKADPSILQAGLGISCLHWLFVFEEQRMHRTAGLLLQHGASVSSRITGPDASRGLRRETEHFPFHWPNGTPFHWACHVGSFAAARVLLEYSADVDEVDLLEGKETQRALCLAMLRADSAMVSFLLENGADLEKTEKNSFCALHFLVLDTENTNIVVSRPLSTWGYLGSPEESLREKRECVKLFKEYGGDLDVVRDSPTGGQTALVYASISGDSHGVIALIEAGANANIPELWSGRLPLHLWLMYVNPERIAYASSYMLALETLIHHTKDLRSRDKSGDSFFHAVLQNSGGAKASSQIIEWIQSNASPLLQLINVPNNYGLTPLLLAIGNRTNRGEDALVLSRLLLKLGAEKMARDKYGCDLVWWLVQNESIPEVSCLSMLQDHMADLDDNQKRELLNNSRKVRSGRSGHTALMGMVSSAFLGCVEYSLSLGVDMTAHDLLGRTALEIALDEANVERARLLQVWMRQMHQKPQSLQSGDVKDFLFSSQVIKPELGNGYETNWRRRYEALPRIIGVLVDAGAQTGSMKFTTGVRFHDRIFVERNKALWFRREQQPFYDVWKILYDYDDEQDE